MTVMPRAVAWYTVYCCLNGLLNLALAWGCFYFRSHWWSLVPNSIDYEEAAWAIQMISVTFAVAALVFAAISFTLPSYAGRRRWEVHLVNIVLGAGSVIFTPICLPLLLAWFRPEVRRHYGDEPGEGMVT